jgi:D-sedoheptulose 7-phosphate isomerase/D-glycero-D-manno-heptose 1,7-bisphosphate phosphatase
MEGPVTGRPGILLDRDGTIIVDYHYVGHIERVQFIPGAIEAIRRFNQAGIPVAIVTNQGGVSRGFYPESNVHLVHDYIDSELAKHGAHIDLFLYSPFHPDGSVRQYARDDWWHKPDPGMACQAAESLFLDLHKSVVVGDRVDDMKMAGRIGAHAVHVGHERLRQPPGSRPASFRHFPSLSVAAGYIIERITGVSTSEFPAMHYSGMFSYFQHYSDEITTALSRVDKVIVNDAADILHKAYVDGDHIFIAGNGGAAAIADHMATDHAKHMAAVDTLYGNVRSLTSNSALTSALANDIGYDAIFSWQLEQIAQPGDVLVVFSVSGESRNIIAALQRAKEMGMYSIAITGADAVSIWDASLATVHIEIPATNYGICEDIMSILQHSLAQYIRQSQMSGHAIQSARF